MRVKKSEINRTDRSIALTCCLVIGVAVVSSGTVDAKESLVVVVLIPIKGEDPGDLTSAYPQKRSDTVDIS